MSSPVIQNFMKQQGFAPEPPDACNMHFAGLYFQPRIVFPTLLVGMFLQAPTIFLLVSALLWWNVLLPGLNPFERLYNRLVATRRGTPPLVPAPGPRRFAQAMAAAFTLAAGLCLLAGWSVASWVFQGFLVVAFSALLFGKFCLGAWVFHVLRGEVAFANSTLPWSRG